MENQTTTISDFQMLGKLGEGAFGQVFKVRRKADKQIYALKKVRIAAMKQKDRENALNQIRILASYEGQYIVGYKDSFFDEVSNTLCVVMQFAARGDLLKSNQTHSKRKTTYPESEIWKALVHISKGVKSLHDRKVLHRDIKAANIFITEDGVYKLGDLNVSKVLKTDLARTQTGTPYYISPEIWKDRPYGVKSDIWSLGCVIYEMAASRPPFLANDLQGLYRNVCKGIYPRIPVQYSQDLAMMINSLLKQDPTLRPTTDQILADPAVHEHFEGVLEENIDEANASNHPLLKTFKLNHKNLRAIKKILPKSNYSRDQLTVQKDKSKQKSTGEGDGSESLRSQRKSVKQIIDEKKINNFLQEQKKKDEDKRKNLLKVINEQQQERSESRYRNRRERVFSACGVRKNAGSMTPEPKKKESNVKLPPSNRISRKENINNPCKLPPRPQIQCVNLQPGCIPKAPKIQQYRNNDDEKSIERSRERSRENFRNIGENIIKGSEKTENSNNVKDRPRVRCNSAKKIVYPSWWMD